MLAEHWDEIQEEMRMLQGPVKIEMWLKFAEYVMPKQARIEQKHELSSIKIDISDELENLIRPAPHKPTKDTE